MKKHILILTTLAVTAFFSNDAMAQTASGWDYNTPSGDITTNSNTDNVGIKTTAAPDWSLTVNGSLGYQPDASSNDYRHFSGATHNGLAILSNTAGAGWSAGSGILMHSNVSSSTFSDKGSIAFLAAPINDGDPAFNFAIGNDGFVSRLFINKSGQVGLSTLNVNNDKLTVNGSISFAETNTTYPNTDWYKHIKGRSHTYGLTLYSDDDNWANSSAVIINSTAGTDAGIRFVSSGNGTSNAYEFKNFTPATATWDQPLTITKDGQVVIGTVPTVDPNLYKLYVEKGILTPRLKVAIPGSAEWSDFVFADDYNLKSLDEVEAFINENKHLPDVPSAENVVKNGIDVGKMDATLLQKIEELTLYVIDQQKQINELKSKLNK